jgi:hypothetical protein
VPRFISKRHELKPAGFLRLREPHYTSLYFNWLRGRAELQGELNNIFRRQAIGSRDLQTALACIHDDAAVMLAYLGVGEGLRPVAGMETALARPSEAAGTVVRIRLHEVLPSALRRAVVISVAGSLT